MRDPWTEYGEVPRASAVFGAHRFGDVEHYVLTLRDGREVGLTTFAHLMRWDRPICEVDGRTVWLRDVARLEVWDEERGWFDIDSEVL